MIYKSNRQNPTHFSLSKKIQTTTGNLSTLRYELSNHLNTAYNSFALVCVLQTGAFCIFGRFFQKSFAFIRRLKKSPVLSREKGWYRHLSTRKVVRTWNLIAWNFRSNVSFKVSANGCCTTKPATPMRKSGDAEQRK